jgi:hypothetical protein
MSYRISWDADAFRMLQRIWDEHEDVSDLTRALDEVYETLSEDADHKGESRARGRRILIAPPLGVLFQVNQRLNEVVIVRVWSYRTRSG